MLQSQVNVASTGRLTRSSRRVQLGVALLLGAALPWLIRVLFEPQLVHAAQVQTTALANVVAIVFAFYSARSLTAYPGYRGGLRMLTVLLFPYALVFLMLIALRVDYSRVVLLGGMVVSSLWFLWVFSSYSRADLLTAGVVPFGSVELLQDLKSVSWVPLTEPSCPLPLNAVVADFRADLPEPWERFLSDCALRGIPVYHVKDLWESLTGRARIDHLSENNLGSLIPARVYVKSKYALDWVIAAFAIVALLPVFLAVAVWIKLDSPGPVFYRQERMGFGGSTFTVYKFRTMALGADTIITDAREAAMTREDDPRITDAGRILRRTRIDELPQVLNILKGEMSWIGPRPEAASLSQWYEGELPFYRYRHIVRPGITGWAQVSQGHVADVDEVFSKLQYDFYYIKNFSPWLDVFIVLKTLQTVFTGFGAR